jgi:hypothetical protein
MSDLKPEASFRLLCTRCLSAQAAGTTSWRNAGGQSLSVRAENPEPVIFTLLSGANRVMNRHAMKHAKPQIDRKLAELESNLLMAIDNRDRQAIGVYRSAITMLLVRRELIIASHERTTQP